MSGRIEKLKKLIKEDCIMDMASLLKVLQTKSRMTVFRHLTQVGYLSSYSHSGRYYTIKGVPNFDSSGLWYFGGALFSKYGNLRTTLVHFIENSEAGITHAELKNLLHLSVHHTLHDLIRKKFISRKRIEKLYLYISCDVNNACTQVSFRQRQIENKRETYPLNPFETIEVLVDLLHSEDWSLKSVVSRLKIKNIKVSNYQIDEIFSRYSIKKKIST